MFVKYNISNNDEYNKILSDLDKDEKEFNELNCENTNFLNCNNQKNYYFDVFGNNIISDTKDYLANYYSTINSKNQDFCVPVKTVPFKKPDGYNINNLPDTDKPYYNNLYNIYPLNEKYTDFIIPIQYSDDVNKTNLYNIDFSRLINPYSIY